MRGFSVLEITLAFALLTLVMGGVILADFSNTYWIIASQTNGAGLAAAKVRLESLRAAAQEDFYEATSSTLVRAPGAPCDASTLCYFVGQRVEDISPCSKYVEVETAWEVPGYPTSTVMLPTALTSPAFAYALGGDCALTPPAGVWGSVAAGPEAVFPAAPTSIDVLAGAAYLSSLGDPYLFIYKDGVISYAGNFRASDPINALDAARDTSNGKVYVYAAMASSMGQLAVIDVTDINKPVEVSRIALHGVDPDGSSPQGWRLAYLDRTIYIVTRNTAGPELHVVDVSDPAAPVEQGSGLNLGTSAYGIVVRDEKADGVTRRFAYLATTLDRGELMVVDVTDPAAPAVAATFDLDDTGCGLSDKPDGTALFISGETLFVGRAHSAGSCPELPDIYALDISDPLRPHMLASGVAGGGVLGLRAAGKYIFVYASTLASPTYTSLLDVEGDDVFAAQYKGNTLQVWDIDPLHFVKIAQRTLTPSTLQMFYSL